jgi:hypothetical protein
MKKVKLFFSVAAVIAMSALMGAGSAMAATATGKVTKIDDYGSSNYAYVYIRPLTTSSTPSTAVKYCKTKTTTQMTMASAAASGNVTITIWGDNTNTTGFLGNCTYIDTVALN